MQKKSLAILLLTAAPALATTLDPSLPTWWNKYLHLSQSGAASTTGASQSSPVGLNVDVSNECGPQSETFIAIDPSSPSRLAAGSNEIFRNPMRGYFSSDGGNLWGGVDLPLPACLSENGTCFGSDPTLAFDSRGNLYYGYIVVFFSAGRGRGAIQGTEVGVARSTDGGATYSQVAFFNFNGGADHFNDKPMITADANPLSPFRDRVYIAWDAASGGSATGGGVHVARSSDGGQTWAIARVDDPGGPGRSIGATITVGPGGEVYAAWNDFAARAITFNRSLDGGATWGTPRVIATQGIGFQIVIPAQSFRGALVYPACGADRSQGPLRGRLSCAWMDLKADGHTDIFASISDDRGASWSLSAAVGESISGVDRFNHWLAVDQLTGAVDVSYYDTRNDTTTFGYMTDVYLSQGDGAGFSPSLRITSASSNEHDCNGVFPCASIDYGNQYGDYEGVAASGGVVHLIWTDSRRNQTPAPGCSQGLMEEVFTATVE